MPMVKAPLTIEYGLLGFVRQQPLHGYEIAQRLRATEELGLSWGWKQSQVYAELMRLEQDGYLTSEVEVQGTRPPRKVFRLTATGDAAFDTWIASPVPHGRDFQLEFPAKLYFAQQEGSAAARTLIARQQEACQSWLVGMRAQDQPHEADQDYAHLVQQFRISQIETILAWLATCANQLRGEGDA
ncbi:PadR family transcriptional regulator [Chloroflexales bacterium ZM16-3]|nr:PadR family transcriptional regulator [Chloroflexales bacterium ZM16-3]